MRRTLKVKFLVFLVAGLILFGTGVHYLHGYQMKRNAKALLDLAAREEQLAAREEQLAARKKQANHLLTATKYLSRYLVFMPRDVDALAKYGLLLEKMAVLSGFNGENPFFVNAYFAFDKLLRLDPDRPEIRWKLARMAMTAERYSRAQPHLEIIYKALPNNAEPKQKAELERMLGLCCAASRKFEGSSRDLGAKEYFQESIKNYSATSIQDAPEQIESYLSLANLYRRQLNNPEEAGTVMEALIAKDSKSFLVYLARARYWKGNQFPEKAAKDIERAYAEDIERTYKLSPDYALPPNPDLPPDGARVFLLFAELARDRGKRAANVNEARKAFQLARGALERGLQFFSTYPAFYQLLAEVELADGKPAEAKACLQRGLKTLPGHNELLWMLANLLIDQGQDAEREIKQMKKGGVVSVRLDSLRARALINRGKWLEAARELERIRPGLVKDPESTKEIDVWLGQCYSQLEEPDLAYLAYRRALEPDPLDVPACLGMSSALVAMGRIDEAIETYRRIVSQSPSARLESARLLIRKNLGLAEEQRRWQKIEEYLNDAEVVKAFPVDVILLRVDLLAAQGNLDQACKLLSDQDSKVVEFRIALAELVGQQGKAAAALMILDEAEKQLGDQVALRLARAEYWANREPSTAGPALAKLAKDLQPFSAPDRQRILSTVASSYVRLGDMKEAQRLWDQLAKEHPDDLNTRLLLFDLALDSGDEPSLHRLLAEINKGSDETVSQFCKARYLIWQAKTRPDQKGEEVSKDPLAEARTLLKTVAERRPLWSGVPLGQALIEDVVQTRENKTDYSKAIEYYLRAIELGERKPAAMQRVLQLLYDAKRYREADEILKKLPGHILLSPRIQQLAAQGRKQQFQAALKARPKDIITLRSAAAFELQMGQSEDAKNHSEDAKNHLEAIMKLRPKNHADYRWARNRLALLLVASGYYKESQEALALLSDRDSDDLEDMRTRALVLFGQKSLHQRREAIVILQKMIAQQPSTPEHRYLLAQVYESVRDWPKAREQLRQLLAISPDKAAYVAYFAKSLVRHQETNETKARIDELERMPDEVGTFNLAEIKAWYLATLGKPEEAIAAVSDYLEGKISKRPDRAVRLPLAAALLDNLSQAFPAEKSLSNAADQRYRELVAMKPGPDQVLLRAAFLGRQGRVAEALDLCEAAWQISPADRVGPVCMSILHAGPATDGDRERVERWLKEHIAKQSGTSTGLLVCLADLRDLQGNYADAEKLYRNAIEKEPHNFEALNNLAWLLAFRKKEAEALELINRAIAIAGPEPALLDTQGVVHLAMGNAERAIQDLEQAMDAQPTAACSFHLAEAQIRRDPLAAATAWDQAKVLGLQPERLHSLERSAYDELRRKLEP